MINGKSQWGIISILKSQISRNFQTKIILLKTKYLLKTK